MGNESKEVNINGINYVQKDMVETCDNYFIVRTYSAGIFAGEIVKRTGQEVEMKNARRLWYWAGAASLSQLAIDGVGKPENCKFPEELPSIVLLQSVEIIPCSEKARNSIAGVKVWKM